MNRLKFLPVFLIAVLAAAPFTPAQQDNPVHISGAGIPASDWSVDQIKKQLASEITPISYAGHGPKHLFNCVPLLSLLKAAGVPTELKMQPKNDPKNKSYSLRFILVARGRDGYVVAFSLAEIMPDMGGRHVWVALDEDGQPITGDDGPIRILSPDDQKPARSVHELAELQIVDASATTRPDAP